MKQEQFNALGTYEEDRRANSGGGRKALLVVVGIAVVLLGGVLIWKALQVNNIRHKAKEEQDLLKDEARIALVQAHKDHLRLLAQPFAWALRTELLAGNLGQANQYMTQIVQEKNIQSVELADAKGVVISSTDKKNEGRPYAAIGPAARLTVDSTLVDEVNDSTLVVSSPIMGFNSRLGTLVITYRMPPPVFIH